MRLNVFRHHWCKPVSQRECLRWIMLLAALIVPVLAGCVAVGPDYVPVEPKAPSKWKSHLEDGLNEASLNPETLARWWTTIKDPQLSSLEQRAVEGNLDLQAARARIREARALRGISQAQLFPTADATGSITKSHSSADTGLGTTTTLYSAGFDAGWELDIFGGVRRAVEAAQADLEASQEQLRDVLVSLLAEVALNYLEVRTFQARLTVTEKNIKAQQETYELNHSRFQAGIISELPVKQALYNLERSRSQIPSLQAGLAAAKNRLAVLLGESPGALDDELNEEKPIPVPPLSVAVGVPAETLRHRPDIRRAERILAAQTARIGVATADLYPKFRLFGSIGLESFSNDVFLDYSNRTWGFGPGASWNIFDAGAIRQNIKVQTALQEQALIQYESTVLGALEEVEDVLVAYAKVRRRREYLAKATEAARQADLLARDQFNAGLVDFSNVLITQLALLSLEDDLAQSEGAATSTLVRLYKALGGGWKSLEPDSTSSKK
ncbi:MAG: efflux transporter outer membrane subunit [Deltaproteobacteria bacterium]|jgi:multidrug efflux system outer membrane protein